ncbi:MAG: hypothetical protein JWN40_710 [Phycisphaerales bacterium]|nr:hypothetical protein [Phycisphaerales bacterium]
MTSATAAIYAVDLLGTASFAFSGALRAIDRRPDFVGMLILASVTALGGGVLRDVILKRDILFLHDFAYPLMVLLSVIAVTMFPAHLLRRERVFRYFDAVGLGVFSASTAAVTWHTPGVNPLSVLFVATATGCAGGVVRDLMIEKPSLVLANELYVTPAILGAAALIFAEWLGATALVALFIAMSLTTAIRIMAIRWEWRLPRIPLPLTINDQR